ncbi:MAG: hypothetical protein ACPGVG_17390, partial [Mycobacterium sp.]
MNDHQRNRLAAAIVALRESRARASELVRQVEAVQAAHRQALADVQTANDKILGFMEAIGEPPELIDQWLADNTGGLN